MNGTRFSRSRTVKRSANNSRCRRGSETSSGHSSCSSSEVSSYMSVMQSDSGMSCMDLGSIAEHVFEDLSIQGNKGHVSAAAAANKQQHHPGSSSSSTSIQGFTTDTATTDTDTTETVTSPRIPIDDDVIASSNCDSANHEAGKGYFELNFNITSAEDASLHELFRQVLDWLDPELDIFKPSHSRASDKNKDKGYYSMSTLDIPSLAIVLFLQEDSGTGDSRAKQAKAFFNNRPWKVHHSEWVGGTVQMYPDNSHDYYMLTPDRPLCSVRQIHCGSEHLRVMRYVTSKNWRATIDLYKLILNQNPNVMKKDFCLFTVSHHAKYDLQFALKKLPRGTIPKKTRKVEMCFHVSSMGSLASMSPNPCHKLSDVLWVTRDLDGNRIYLKVNAPMKLHKRCRSVSPSKLMSRNSRSAFSPVVPAKPRPSDDNGVFYARESKNLSLMDKLSPRVYVTKKASTSVIPKRPPSNSSRTSDSSTGISSVSQANYDGFVHDHTDSGFIEDTVSRDPRRTPIIGTHLSKFSQYDRFISTPNGEINFQEDAVTNKDVIERVPAQPKGLSQQSLAWVEQYVESQNQRITKLATPSPSFSPRVTPTNTGPSPSVTPTNRHVSPSITPTNKTTSPCVTPTNNVPHSGGALHRQSPSGQQIENHPHVSNQNGGTMPNSGLPQDVQAQCSSCLGICACTIESNNKLSHAHSTTQNKPPILSSIKHNDYFRELSCSTGNSDSGRDTLHSNETSLDINDAELLTPRCPSVDAESHDLQAYMKLRWGINSDQNQNRVSAGTSNQNKGVGGPFDKSSSIKCDNENATTQGITKSQNIANTVIDNDVQKAKKPPIPAPKPATRSSVNSGNTVYENVAIVHHTRAQVSGPRCRSASPMRAREAGPSVVNTVNNRLKTYQSSQSEDTSQGSASNQAQHQNISQRQVQYSLHQQPGQQSLNMSNKANVSNSVQNKPSQQRPLVHNLNSPYSSRTDTATPIHSVNKPDSILAADKSNCVTDYIKQFESHKEIGNANHKDGKANVVARNNSSGIPQTQTTSSKAPFNVTYDKEDVSPGTTSGKCETTSLQQTPGPTLGQFLSQNKTVTEYLKRSPNNSPCVETINKSEINISEDANMPQSSNNRSATLGNSKDLHLDVTLAMNHAAPSKEGTPEDMKLTKRANFNSISSDNVFESPKIGSETPQSCISKQLHRPKKRVRISEMNNSHHIYEAGQEHGFVINDDLDTESDDGDDVIEEYANELESNDITQGCYNLKSGKSTFDSNISKSSECNTNAAHFPTGSISYNQESQITGRSLPNKNPACKAKENLDWQKIKSEPEIGFYI